MNTNTNSARPANAPGKGADFRRLTTRDVPVAERFDYWRSLFRTSRIERPQSSRSDGFEGEIVTSTTSRDVMFSSLRGEPVVCHFGAHDRAGFLLGCVRSGTVVIRSRTRDVTCVRPQTGLVLFDCERPLTTTSGEYAMDFLMLPRELVTQVMTDTPLAGNAALRVLQPDALTASLRQHLQGLGKGGMRLDTEAATTALNVARGLTVATLAGEDGNWRALASEYDRDILLAAHHELQRHAADPGFTATRLSATLGCSRAHLYRLFEGKGQSVTGQLREIRLRRARTMLETCLEQPIGMIAMHCGYTDQSAFGKAFRRRFDLTPGECRRQTLPTV